MPSTSQKKPPNPRAAALLRRLRAFVRDVRQLTQSEIDEGTTYGGFLPAVVGKLEAFEEAISAASAADEDEREEGGELSIAAAAVRAHFGEGGSIVTRRQQPYGYDDDEDEEEGVGDGDGVGDIGEGGDALWVVISGPGVGDEFVCPVSGEDEALEVEEWVREYQRFNDMLAKMEQRFIAAATQKSDGGRPKLGNNHGQKRTPVTPRDKSTDAAASRVRINLLRQYNDLKDVGQQLIGLVAENRGVSVGSLYRDEEFGVGPDD